MRGMRVCPPTSTTSLIFPASMPASFMHCLHGPTDFCAMSSTIASNFARVSFLTRCLGPEASAVMNGRLILVCIVVESAILARSAASRRRCSAISLPLARRSRPSSFLNSSISQSTSRWSMLSPPRWVSPLVAFTSMTPSPTSRIEILNVPPHKTPSADLENRNIDRAAAEVVHGDGLVLALVEPVGERGRRRLVDDALHFAPGTLAGVFGALPLGGLEV